MSWGHSFLAVACGLAFTALRAGASADQPAPAAAKASLVIVVGAEGEESYRTLFKTAGSAFALAGQSAQASVHSFGVEENENADVHEALRSLLAAEPTSGSEPLWLVLIGHGTVDGKEGKFNLRGTDLSASELAAMLKLIERPVVIVAAFSASGAFLAPLSAPGRAIVTATRSGSETNYAHFAEQIAQTIADPAADLDHDGQTSLLEAWLSAARRVAAFYESDGRLATEHSLLDDNGDGLGTPADWFSGTRVVKKANDARAPDGRRAHQLHLVRSSTDRALAPELRAQRDAVELEIAALRDKKESLPEDEYYAELEALCVRLANIYRGKSDAPPPAR
ncbi:MAG TPA: hypothetical protein VFV83_05670 [Chthoniobacteraceae bacterium]|nr:hypothetical protein [Chthoniobacteraceae bacterium]